MPGQNHEIVSNVIEKLMSWRWTASVDTGPCSQAHALQSVRPTPILRSVCTILRKIRPRWVKDGRRPNPLGRHPKWRESGGSRPPPRGTEPALRCARSRRRERSLLRAGSRDAAEPRPACSPGEVSSPHAGGIRPASAAAAWCGGEPSLPIEHAVQLFRRRVEHRVVRRERLGPHVFGNPIVRRSKAGSPIELALQ